MLLQRKLFCAFAVVTACALMNAWRVSADDPAQDKGKADAMVQHGAYLVKEVARCGDCHTPRDDKGNLDDSKFLQGTTMWYTSKIKFRKWENKVPDITASGLATSWKNDKLVSLLTSGKQTADMPMPAYKLTPDDANAVIAYLKSLPGKKK